MEDPVILKIAENHEKTPAQVILHWLVQNQFGVIPKSSNEGRIRQNMEIFDFRLTDEEMKQMQKLTEKQIRVGDDPRTYRFPLLDEMIAAGKEPERDKIRKLHVTFSHDFRSALRMSCSNHEEMDVK